MQTEHSGSPARPYYRMPALEGRSLQWDTTMDQLVSRAVAGDRNAFSQIYRTLYPEVARYLYYRMGSQVQAEDVASEVFLAAWRQLPTYRGGYFPGWVFGIARNQAIGEIRKVSRRRTIELQRDPEPATVGQPGTDAEEAGAAHERLHRALAHLKEQQREIIVCKFILGMSNAQVAARLGKTENAVNAQQHRGLAALRRIMAKEGMLDD
ncbi:MAG: hypothetical protein NVSMB32_11790 [Actinomycetota bacterium]